MPTAKLTISLAIFALGYVSSYNPTPYRRGSKKLTVFISFTESMGSNLQIDAVGSNKELFI